ncbi:hypothetical protein LCGC14_2418370 [marine sediment metagenome]|uniref:Uncharacterized protein n=1 Tax=marine sediment metagenome TaxID=412755 RepID=A0A0F9E2J0_9ZZZZ
MVEKKRKSINVATLKKVEDFLKDQDDPVYKSDVVKAIGVDFDSLTLALNMLNVEIYKDGRVRLIC